MLYLLILFLSNIAWATPPECKAVEREEELEVYLVTSGPGTGIYTQVGHSALWVSGGNQDEAFYNWGTYDLSQENFLWHFFMGTAYFRLSLMSRERSDGIATRENRMVTAQHLNLSSDMKIRLQRKLNRRAKAGNRNYIYHWEKKNCATLIRDMIDASAGLPWQELKQQQIDITRRHEVLRHLGPAPLAWFGWHFMAADHADQPYSAWDSLHIPENLMKQAQQTTILWEDGSKHPLVDYECLMNDSPRGWAATSPPSRWPWLWGIGLVLSGLLWKGVPHSNRIISLLSKLILSTHFFIAALLGTIFPFFWLSSKLLGYGPNENWFYANPLSFGLMIALWKRYSTEKLLVQSATCMAVMGIITNLFTTQVNIDFIGFFGFPLLGFYLFVYLPRQR